MYGIIAFVLQSTLNSVSKVSSGSSVSSVSSVSRLSSVNSVNSVKNVTRVNSVHGVNVSDGIFRFSQQPNPTIADFEIYHLQHGKSVCQ